MKTDPSRKVRLRSAVVSLLFVALFGTIAVRAAQLQVVKGSWLSSRAERQYQRVLTVTGKRGTIVDTNGDPLAVSVQATSIAADPRLIKDPYGAAKRMAPRLNISRKVLQKKLASKRHFVWLKREVTPDVVEAIRGLDIAGLHFMAETSRVYPAKTQAGQLLGFASIDGRGLEGVEFFYEKQLQASSHKIQVAKDALGRGFDGPPRETTALNGKDVQLTIDRNIQFITEKALEEAVTTHEARNGLAVVMAPDSGAVLALAHYPYFNPNAFGDFQRDDWRNRAVTDPFEPGSTMKIFSAAAAIDSGLVRADSIFYCENGAYRIGRNTVHDTKEHGWLSLQQIVKYSSNIGSVKVAETIGAKTLHRYLTAFGFGSRTGIDCPGETPGRLSGYKSWSAIDNGAISFGQGVSVSALQLTAAAAAIANGGRLMQPYLVKAIIDASGKVVQQRSPKTVRRVVSPQTARTIQKILHTVTTSGGTGEAAALEGYTVCGKTGTAQKIGPDGRYAPGKYVSSFLGFAPAEAPALAILVVVDEPRKSHYGGQVAGPAFRTIAQETLHYLNVMPAHGMERLRVAIDEEVKG
ncbi:MAG: penicillin-binding protein 2 [Desulfosarcinaceae bacterium]|nr:penicillin-binding protein 2 [Desulfosarcinaceae bacterium]